MMKSTHLEKCDGAPKPSSLDTCVRSCSSGRTPTEPCRHAALSEESRGPSTPDPDAKIPRDAPRRSGSGPQEKMGARLGPGRPHRGRDHGTLLTRSSRASLGLETSQPLASVAAVPQALRRARGLQPVGHRPHALAGLRWRARSSHAGTGADCGSEAAASGLRDPPTSPRTPPPCMPW